MELNAALIDFVASSIAGTLVAGSDLNPIQPLMTASMDISNGRFALNIRYATALDSVMFDIGRSWDYQMRVASIIVDNPGGTRDASVRLDGPSDFDEADSGAMPLRMINPATGDVLETLYFDYYRGTNQGHILTQQPSFEEQANGNQSKAILKPAIGLDVQSRAVFVSYQTPENQSFVQIARAGGKTIDSLGRAAMETAVHPGGTQTGLVQLSVPANTPMGDLEVQLFDRPWGNIIASRLLHWDGQALSVVDDGQNPGGAQEHFLLQSSQGLRPDLAQIQRLNMYYQSTFFVDGDQLEILLQQRNIDGVFPADREAYLTEQMQRTGLTRGDVENELLYEQSAARTHYHAVLNYYEQVVSGLLQASIEYWVQIKQGVVERPLYDALVSAYNTTNWGEIPLLLDPPNFGQILAEGHRLFTEQYDYLVRLQRENLQLRAIDARNAWIAEQRQGYVADVTRSLQRLIDTMSAAHPEVQAVIAFLNDDQLAYHWAEELVPFDPSASPVTDDVLRAFFTTKIDATLQSMHLSSFSLITLDSEGGSSSGDVRTPMSPESLTRIRTLADSGRQSALARGDQSTADKFTLLFNAANGLLENPDSPDAAEWKSLVERLTTDPDPNASQLQLQKVLSWYHNQFVPNISDRYTVRPDTAMGQLFLGLADKLLSTTDQSVQLMYASSVSQVTSIPLWKIMRSVTRLVENDVAIPGTPTPARAADQFVQLFKDAGFSDIFSSIDERKSGPIPTVHVDKPTYTSADTEIQTRFDVVLGDKTRYNHANVYLIGPDGVPLGGPLTAPLFDSLSLTIPMANVIAQMGSVQSMHVRIAVQLETADGQFFTVDNGMAGLSDGIIVQNDGGVADLKHVPRNWEMLTASERSAVGDVLDLGDLSSNTANDRILTYVLNAIVPALDYKPGLTEGVFEGDVHATGLAQCKAWIQDWLQSAGITAKPIPANMTSSIPGVAAYEWKPSAEDTAQVGVVGSIRDNGTTFEQLIDFANPNRVVQAGHIVQMSYGTIQHTMVILKIEESGMWVVDTNFGNKGEWIKLADGVYPEEELQLETKGIEDPVTHVVRELTKAELDAHTIPTYWKWADNTPRIRFAPFEALNTNVKYATIYAVQS